MNNWPHAPLHKTLVKGTYMVTAATYKKVSYFHSPARIQLQLAKSYQWQLQAWAVLANHYHFIAQSPQDPKTLTSFISQLHVKTSRYINDLDKTPNRQVWWQYWDSHITYQYSYLARLNYVNQNPVRHGLVNDSKDYPWCSGSWFQKMNQPSFVKTVNSFKIDKVKVIDDF
jgi:putative transposase